MPSNIIRSLISIIAALIAYVGIGFIYSVDIESRKLIVFLIIIIVIDQALNYFISKRNQKSNDLRKEINE